MRRMGAHSHGVTLVLPGFLASIATRTMGDASKCRPVNDGQKMFVDKVADFKTRESNCPMAASRGQCDAADVLCNRVAIQ